MSPPATEWRAQSTLYVFAVALVAVIIAGFLLPSPAAEPVDSSAVTCSDVEIEFGDSLTVTEVTADTVAVSGTLTAPENVTVTVVSSGPSVETPATQSSGHTTTLSADSGSSTFTLRFNRTANTSVGGPFTTRVPSVTAHVADSDSACATLFDSHRRSLQAQHRPATVNSHLLHVGPAGELATVAESPTNATYAVYFPDEYRHAGHERQRELTEAIETLNSELRIGCYRDTSLVAATGHQLDSNVRGRAWRNIGQDASTTMVKRNAGFGAGGTWIHEYIHTRQCFETTDETEWLVEGFAAYYGIVGGGLVEGDGAQVTYRLNEHRSDNPPRTLSDPSTWRARTPYNQGAIALAQLDVRLEDSNLSVESLFRHLNNQSTPVTEGDVVQYLREGGATDAAAFYEEITNTATWAGPVYGQSAGDRSAGPPRR